ncbi:hypothetical protein FD755_006940 [Muntiacus reevesi]|uniref:GP-PDE domain-containing protein n=1 Tax=Muntiacus reevesi TaxID=9886 RepID=A0A5J5N368_MUNRE|nr:hypothetical protein FD755_006940 [Muntiacus reevesi]
MKKFERHSFIKEVFAICGSCDALGNWNPQKAVALLPENETGESMLWKATIVLSRGVSVQYRYFKGCFLEPKTIGGPCQVIVHKWETHLQPRSITPLESEIIIDDGQFGIHNGIETLDSGWLTCQTEIRLRLHYSEKPPVSITKKKFKKSRFRVKLTLEGLEEDDDDRVSPTVLHKMSNSLEISLISDNEFKCRHSQPECGYGLQPDRWTEYSIQTMEPDNLELIFDFFEEDLSEHVVQGDAFPGHVGTACLLSSTIAESGKSAGILTLPIMSRNSRKTIGKVRVDYIIIKPLPGYSCDMKSSFSKYWKPRIPLDVGHRGAGNSTTTAQLAKVQENTIASLRNAASHGAAFVEFDVHLSKDFVPVVYHDLTCCLTMKKRNADPNFNEVPPLTAQNGHYQKYLTHGSILNVHQQMNSYGFGLFSFIEKDPFLFAMETSYNLRLSLVCFSSFYFILDLLCCLNLDTKIFSLGKNSVYLDIIDFELNDNAHKDNGNSHISIYKQRGKDIEKGVQGEFIFCFSMLEYLTKQIGYLNKQTSCL